MVVSDDHGRPGFDRFYKEAKSKYGKIDYVIHAGDTDGNDNSYYEANADCEVLFVRGNNDFNSNPSEIVKEIGGKKIFVTHGHRYGVYMGIQTLYYAGLERGADIIIYGHTHKANHQEGAGVHVLNPGSLTGVRSGQATYAMLTINNDDIKVEFNYGT